MVTLGGFLGRHFGLLLKDGLALIGNLLKPLAKSVLVYSGLTAAATATMQLFKKKKKDLLKQKSLIISNEEMDDIMEIVS